MAEKRPVYIIGHKNPDSDSICSAIAYAALKNELYGGGYYAARAGQISLETQYILNFFHTPAPQYIGDVTTEVQDIEICRTQGVYSGISLKKAWNMMRELEVVTLPVTDADGKLSGLITIGDIATAYMDVYDNCILSTARTSYRNILETLEAHLLTGDGKAVFSKGEVIISAANPDVMEDYIHSGDMVILGNRYESQLCAIEMGAACIIVCMNAKVSKTIQRLADERGCSIIVTPYDTFTAARMINQSMPIKYFMKKNHLTAFRLSQKIEEIKEVMGQKRHRDFPVLDDENNYIGMISRRNLINLRKKQLILVDHNEESQAVDGFQDAHILEIIDHHRIGTLQTPEPVLFRNQPLGCTSTIIFQIYQENGIQPPKNIAGLLMAAIISDTLMFRSPTCTNVDRKAAEALSGICGVNIEAFAADMFAAGSDLSSKQPKEILEQDMKKFEVGNIRFSVSQINSMNAIELKEIKEKLLPYLEKIFPSLGLDMAFVMLTNIVKESTELLCFGDRAKETARAAFQLHENKKDIKLKGLVSRKKQLIPSLVSALQQA